MLRDFFGIILRMGVLKSDAHAMLAGIVAVFFVLLKANRARCYDRSSTTRTSRRLFRAAGVCLRKRGHLAKRHRAGADFPPRVARRHTGAVCGQAARGVWVLLSCDQI